MAPASAAPGPVNPVQRSSTACQASASVSREFALTGVVSSDAATAFQSFTHESFPGKWQVVFFWPKDFTFVCPTEIAAFGKLEQGVPRPRCAAARREHRQRVRAPRLAAREGGAEATCRSRCSRTSSASSPARSASSTREAGVAQRATFIVDPQGVIRFVYVTDLNVGRSPEEVLRVLDALQTDELCPCNWQQGR